MPKSTHQHQKDAINTDKKYRPDDEGIYARDKQEFQESEQEKRLDEDSPEKKAKRDDDRTEE
jgi:hypothetical protein